MLSHIVSAPTIHTMTQHYSLQLSKNLTLAFNRHHNSDKITTSTHPIHFYKACNTITNYNKKISKLIQATSPSINTSKASLTKPQCRTPAQFKANTSLFFIPHLHKVDASHKQITFCLLYNTHDTTHFLTCTYVPIQLTTLWTNPKHVVLLLDTRKNNITGVGMTIASLQETFR